MIATQISPSNYKRKRKEEKKKRENQVFDLERKEKVVEDSRAGNSQSRKKNTCLTIGLEKERPGKDSTRRQLNYSQESRQIKREDVPETLRTS